MASEVEQAIDDMLSGLQALQRQAQAAPVRNGEPLADSRIGTSAAQPLGQDEGLAMLMMAVLESQPDQPCASSARRWIVRQLDEQALPLGDLGGERHADVRVSPRMHAALKAAAAQGAVLAECDAQATSWLWPSGDRDALRRVFGRMFSAVCLEQDLNALRFRVPKIPERLALRFFSETQPDSSIGVLHASAYAVVDLDNLRAQPSTVFWLEDGGLVPDYLCAVTHHAGRWWPVVRASGD